MHSSYWQSVTVFTLLVIVSTKLSEVSSDCSDRRGVCIAENRIVRQDRQIFFQKGHRDNASDRSFRDSLRREIAVDRVRQTHSGNRDEQRRSTYVGKSRFDLGSRSEQLDRREANLRRQIIRNDFRRTSRNILIEERVPEERLSVREVLGDRIRYERRVGHQIHEDRVDNRIGEDKVDRRVSEDRLDRRVREGRVDRRVREDRVDRLDRRERGDRMDRKVREDRIERQIDENRMDRRVRVSERHTPDRVDNQERDNLLDAIHSRQVVRRNFNRMEPRKMRRTELHTQSNTRGRPERSLSRYIKSNNDEHQRLYDRRNIVTKRLNENDEERRDILRHEQRQEELREIRQNQMHLKERFVNENSATPREDFLRRDFRQGDKLYIDNQNIDIKRPLTRYSSELTWNVCQALLVGAIVLQLLKYKNDMGEWKSFNGCMSRIPLLLPVKAL